MPVGNNEVVKFKSFKARASNPLQNRNCSRGMGSNSDSITPLFVLLHRVVQIDDGVELNYGLEQMSRSSRSQFPFDFRPILNRGASDTIC